MRNIICILLCLAGIILSCKNSNNLRKNNVEECTNKCYFLSPHIEIWNHSGKDFIIGNWGERKDRYEQSHGWNSTDFPYPKKFDLKLIIDNNPLLYENPMVIGKWFVSIDLKFKIGRTENGTYLLNSKTVEGYNILNNVVVSDNSFLKNSRIELGKYNIEFEKIYNKYIAKNLYINQLIFEISLIQGNKKCIYEYIFPMAGEQEM